MGSDDNRGGELQWQILEQLKCINQRLDAVEGQVADASKMCKTEQHRSEQCKLSSCFAKSKGRVHSKFKVTDTRESDSDSDASVPSLSELRSSVKIQRAQSPFRMKNWFKLRKWLKNGPPEPIAQSASSSCSLGYYYTFINVLNLQDKIALTDAFEHGLAWGDTRKIFSTAFLYHWGISRCLLYIY